MKNEYLTAKDLMGVFNLGRDTCKKIMRDAERIANENGETALCQRPLMVREEFVVQALKKRASANAPKE